VGMAMEECFRKRRFAGETDIERLELPFLMAMMGWLYWLVGCMLPHDKRPPYGLLLMMAGELACGIVWLYAHEIRARLHGARNI
jgi:hypothetical protein